MPKDFTECVNSGGKVVTKSLKGNRYIHICYDKDGNSYTSEVKTRKKKKTKASNHKKKIRESRALADDLRKLKRHFDEKYRM